MTRSWTRAASRSLISARSASARPRRHRANLGVENLEYRLALSSSSAGALASPDLNPRPVAPGRAVPVVVHGAPAGNISLNLMKLVVEPAEPDTLTRPAPAAPIQGMPATSHFRTLHRFAVPNAPSRAVVRSGRGGETSETPVFAKDAPTNLDGHPHLKPQSASGATDPLKNVIPAITHPVAIDFASSFRAYVSHAGNLGKMAKT
jgi:hypothetical protein